MPKKYDVQVCIAGHAIISVEAESKQEAIDKAINSVELTDIESWEALEAYHQGSVCYCPTPWESSVIGGDDEDSD